MWSKITGCSLLHVAYTKEEDYRNWLLEGSVGEISFQMNIRCATDVSKFDYSHLCTTEQIRN